MRNASLKIAITKVNRVNADVENIQKLRYRVYSQEMGLNLPGIDAARGVLTDPLDAPAIHISALMLRDERKTDRSFTSSRDAVGSLVLDSELVGTVRLNVDSIPDSLETFLDAPNLPKPFVYCSRLCVLDSYRGKGIVQELNRACFRQFRHLAASVAVCHCYPHLLKAYERVGFEPYGTQFMLPGLEDLGYQTPMRCLLTRNKADQAA